MPGKSIALTKIPEYKIWTAMKTRCYNRRATQYHRYGARGIFICQRWLGDGGFARFLSDMGERPAGHSIERRDNSGPYSPENCFWATQKQQCRNRENNRRLEWQGRTLVL